VDELRISRLGRVLGHAAVGAGVFLAATGPGVADEGFFIGDSIAAGASSILGIKGIARPSVSLRRTSVVAQFSQIPSSAVGLMSLGVNDAADPVEVLRKDIEVVIAGAQGSGRRIVWIGPPCVLKDWDRRAKQLDEYLRQRLATTDIQYVSLRDAQICQPAMRTKDGAHFTPEGYRYVWQKTQRDSTFAALVVIPRKPRGGTEVAAAEAAVSPPRSPAPKATVRTPALSPSTAAPDKAKPAASAKRVEASANQGRHAKSVKEVVRRPQREVQTPQERRRLALQKAPPPKSTFRLETLVLIQP
jgi:hypothetical protein